MCCSAAAGAHTRCCRDSLAMRYSADAVLMPSKKGAKSRNWHRTARLRARLSHWYKDQSSLYAGLANIGQVLSQHRSHQVGCITLCREEGLWGPSGVPVQRQGREAVHAEADGNIFGLLGP